MNIKRMIYGDSKKQHHPLQGVQGSQPIRHPVRKGDAVMASTDINHESIHTAQMKEMLYVLFYLWYVIEWLVRLVRYRNAHTAYRSISFEREAYMNQGIMGYLQGRGRYAWVKYLKGGGNG